MKYLSIPAFVLLLFACCGWGYALVRWADIRDRDNFAFLSVVGIAWLVFLGGILNLVRLAYPAALIILLVSGWVFFFIYGSFSAHAGMWLARWRTGSLIDPEKTKSLSGYALPIAILAIAAGFYAWTLLPDIAFNFSDDFYAYLPRPFRMLQTGTLSGNPYEVLGTDTLGAQAFLQGFVLLGFPVGYLQGLDAVFSFALAGLLLIALGKKFNLHWGYVVFALIGFILINPQSVNVSAIYLGSAIILGIIFASCQLLEQMEKPDSGTPAVTAGILGLLLAALLGLKNTFLPFTVAYFTIFFAGLLWISADKQKILKICGLTMLAAFLTLLPWLALYAANFVSAVQIALHPSAVTAVNLFTSMQGHISSFFSATHLYYGGSFLGYGIIILMLILIGIYSVLNIFDNKVAPVQRGWLLVAMTSCMAGVASYFFFGFNFLPVVAVRYSCPVLIAILPFAWLAASMAISNSPHRAKLLNPSGIRPTIILVMVVLIAIMFGSNFTERVARAYYHHMTFALPLQNPELYNELNRGAISTDTRSLIRGIQDKTEPGQKIFVWISQPMHLDFSRNEIYLIMGTSLLNPWLDIPFDGSAEDMVQFLKGQGIRYIMWQINDALQVGEFRKDLLNPFPVYRRKAQRGLYMRKTLASIMSGGSFLYNANGIVLFDLQQVK